MQVKNKITKLRTCLYSNQQYEKDKLLRFVKVNNKLVIDKNQKLPGRGYYLYISKEAINDPKLGLVLSKRTKCCVDNDLIDQLKQYK